TTSTTSTTSTTTTTSSTTGTIPSTTTTSVTTTTDACTPLCGNGTIDTECGETCDGDDLGGATCPDDSAGGALVAGCPRCLPGFVLDTSCCGLTTTSTTATS